ncbi:hypothetical protein KHA80_11115 [Anaerobacillus sp. HL2]|nr:hypothetical protein KHA80_11115 [Anaerobacillus sp. HL2]
MKKSVIVSGARTPFGKFGGSLSEALKAVELGGAAIKGALDRANVSALKVDECILGMVLQGGQGQLPLQTSGKSRGLPWR